MSYAHEDEKFARQLTRRLRELHRVPWRDVRDIRGGDNYEPTIDEALRNAEAVVVVMSPNATKSEYVTYEWAFALGARVRVIPVVLKSTTLHPRLSRIQYIDLTTRRGTPWVDLQRALPGRPASIRTGPRIHARFNIVDGEPEMQNGYYVMRVYLNHPPRHTEQVTYEVHDETPTLGRSSSKAAATKFESTMLSNGDLLITATIRSTEGKTLHITSPLFEALRRGHGTNPGKTIRGALRKIGGNRAGVSGR